MDQAVARIGLGAARFGAPRGTAGPFGAAEAFAAVALALDAGVGLIDAPVGGATPALDVLAEVLTPEAPARLSLRVEERDPSAVMARVRTALSRLGRTRADLVVAKGRTLAGSDGEAAWAGLQALKDAGMIGWLGIAACVCDRPAELARRFRPEAMQLPLSLLDQRLLTDGTLARVADAGVELHLRAPFLHGVAFYPDVGEAPAHVVRLRALLAEAGADPMRAALHFALGRPEAQAVVVDVGSARELRALVTAAEAPAPDLDWSALGQDGGCEAGLCIAA